MKTTAKKRESHPIISLLEGNQISEWQKAGICVGILLTLCAVGTFIWLIVKAAGAGDARGIVMMSSFILFALGILYYLLARINNPRKAWNMLYLTIPLAVGAFVVSLYLDNGSTAPTRDMQAAQTIEQVYDASGGQISYNDGDLN